MPQGWPEWRCDGEEFRELVVDRDALVAFEGVEEVEVGSVAPGSGGGRNSDRRMYRNDPPQQGSPTAPWAFLGFFLS
jgi:hypothetical protein